MGEILLNDMEKNIVRERARGCKILDYKVYKHSENMYFIRLFLLFMLYGIFVFYLARGM